jgi:hypothetical protein
MANMTNGNRLNTTAAPEDKYQTITDGLYIQTGQLSRIADSLDIIIRMIREDQEESKKRWAESEKD